MYAMRKPAEARKYLVLDDATQEALAALESGTGPFMPRFKSLTEVKRALRWASEAQRPALLENLARLLEKRSKRRRAERILAKLPFSYRPNEREVELQEGLQELLARGQIKEAIKAANDFVTANPDSACIRRCIRALNVCISQ